MTGGLIRYRGQDWNKGVVGSVHTEYIQSHNFEPLLLDVLQTFQDPSAGSVHASPRCGDYWQRCCLEQTPGEVEPDAARGGRDEEPWLGHGGSMLD